MDVQIDRLGHRRDLGSRRHDVDRQPFPDGGLGRTMPERGDSRRSVRTRESPEQRSDLRRTVKDQQVVVGYVDIAQIGADRPGEDYLVEPKLHLLERHRQLGLVGLGKREQEFLVLVLGDQLDERRERSVGEKYLALAVYDVFLQV